MGAPIAEPGLRVLHAIHDFLPRHRAGSEIYAAGLCRELATRRHHITVVCADYDSSRAHGQLTWRRYEELPVIEIVNNWVCSTFADTYRSPLLSARLEQVLQAVQPHVVHVHNLLNLSFDLPAAAKAGDLSPESVTAVMAAGFEAAVSCEERGLRAREHPLRIPRLPTREESGTDLGARLARMLAT